MSLEAAQALADWGYEQAKEEAESSVVRWEWASFTRYSLEPCYFEINRYRRGDLLNEEPAPPLNGARGHGFDAAGRLRVERQQTNEPGCYYETFYGFRPGGTARRHFDELPGKSEINAFVDQKTGSFGSRTLIHEGFASRCNAGSILIAIGSTCGTQAAKQPPITLNDPKFLITHRPAWSGKTEKPSRLHGPDQAGRAPMSPDKQDRS